ncbi:caspase family protein [Bradyrhizobium sp. 21]|nr:caspase family protein [Bradyrhizobium sp. 21]
MKFFCLFILGALTLALEPTGAFADQRMALVMGNSAYQRAPKLSNSANDANLLAETFKKAGFTVVEARNDLSAQDMRRALRDFGAKARSADIAVIYYAGHGIEIDGNNYLVPVDAQLENDTDVYDETIGLDRVLVAIEPAKRLRLVILDACRDNPFSKNMKRTMASRAVARGLAKVEPSSPNTLVAFAAKAGLTALDGDGKNSPFATALAHHLATPGLDLRKAFGYVRDEVLQATTNKQEPFIYGSLGGDDVVLAPAAAPSAPPPAPVASTDMSASRDYEFSERVGSVEAWDLYIAAHPSGFYTDLAKVQRNKLAAVAARPASAPAPAPVAIETKKVQTTPVLPPQPEATKPVAAPKLAAVPATVTPLALTSPPATETKSVAAIPSASCTTRIARRGNDAVGGPFIPVSIKPNVEGASVRTIAIAPNGREIATAGDDGVIRLWDAASFRQTRVLRGHAGAVYALDYWADSTLLASAGWDGKVKVWNLKNDGQSLTFDAGAKQFAVAFAPESSPKYLASAGEDGVVRIWNLGTRDLARSRLDHQSADPARAAVRSLSYAPSGSGEFVSAGFDGKIRFYRTSGAIDARDAYGRKALRVAYSPDGTRLVTAGSDAELGAAKVWDAKGGTARLLTGHRDYVVSASWSADSKRIVTGGGGRDKSVNLWDAESGRLLASFAGHQEDIEAVAFFPGGTRLISASEDKTIKVWDIAERRVLLTAIGFGDDGFVSYTPEGCYAGSSGIESRLSISSGSRYEPMSLEARKAMQEPAGFATLLAR